MVTGNTFLASGRDEPAVFASVYGAILVQRVMRVEFFCSRPRRTGEGMVRSSDWLLVPVHSRVATFACPAYRPGRLPGAFI